MKTAILDSDARNSCGKPIISLVFLWFYVQAILMSDSFAGDSNILKNEDMAKPDYKMRGIL